MLEIFAEAVFSSTLIRPRPDFERRQNRHEPLNIENSLHILAPLFEYFY